MARGCGLKTKLFWQLAAMEEWKPEEYSCLKLSNVTLFRYALASRASGLSIVSKS